MNDSLFIVMPAYNEAAIIENTIKEWYPKLELADDDSKLVIAEGGSSDETYEILIRLKKNYPKLVIACKPNTTHGQKVKYLYKYAAECKADWIFMTDSDGQTNPEEFDMFWKLRHEYDFVIGKRINRGDGKQREFVDKVLRAYLRVLIGGKVPDGSSPYRLMKTSSAERYIALLPEMCRLPNAIMSSLVVKYKEKVIFKEVSFRKRTEGKSKVKIKEVVNLGIRSVSDFMKVRIKAQKTFDS